MIEHNDSSPSSKNATGTGSNQSPINIDTAKAIPKICPPIVMSGYVEETNLVILANTGHTIEVRPPENAPAALLSGGPLKGRYKFLQLHFHWGSSNFIGSEHSINGNFYSMEAHMVHYNENYPNCEAASKKSDGFAVVAIFLEVNDKPEQQDHPIIAGITNHLASVRSAGTTVDVDPEALSLVKDYCFCCSEYFTYHGSRTTFPFSENVTWLIFPIPIQISKRQIEAFRHIHGTGKCRLTSNTRHIQLLGDRKIYIVKKRYEPTDNDDS